MSQLVMLILPAPADLDSIRDCLADRFTVNAKAEGLGDAEELNASDEFGRTTVFEAIPAAISEMLRQGMKNRALNADDFTYFHVRYGWGMPEAALLQVAESLRLAVRFMVAAVVAGRISRWVGGRQNKARRSTEMIE